MPSTNDENWLVLVDACNSAALGVGSWTDALAGLAAATNSRSGQLIGFGASATAGFNWLTDLDPDLIRQVADAGGTDPASNPRLAAGMRAGTLSLITDTEVISRQERRRHPIYAEFLDRYDVPFICATNVVKDKDLAVGLAVLRSRSQGEIEGEQRRLFASIAPHVRSAVLTQITLEGQGAQLLSGALEALDLPVFICDRNGQVRAFTAGAEALLGAGLWLKQGRLSAGLVEDTNRLREAIRHAATGLSQPGAPATSTVLIRHNAEAPLVMDVISLPRRAYGFGFEPRVLAVAHRRQPNPQRSHLLLQAVYGLTSAETEVAQQLADGRSPEAIAAARYVSVGTVRTQIRSIYAKLDVSRQIELVNRLRQLTCL